MEKHLSDLTAKLDSKSVNLGSVQSKMINHLTGDRPPAVVLRSDRAHGLAFVRSLGRKKVRVVAINQTKGPGRFSRYALNINLPSDLPIEMMRDLLIRVGKSLPHKPFLVPTTDKWALFIARNREDLSPYYSFVLVDTKTAERVANKWTQYEIAARAKIPLPKTFRVESLEQLTHASRSIAYPCILKPVYADLWREYREAIGQTKWKKLAYVSSPIELVSVYQEISRSGLEFILQEFIPGDDSQIYNMFLYFDRNSELVASLARQKLRQWPVKEGSGCYLVSVHSPEIIKRSKALLQKLNYSGLADVEYKKDARDGEFRLVEINIRCATHVSMAIDSGVDFPYIAYRDALGLPVSVIDQYDPGRYWLDIGQDVRSYFHSRSRGGIGFVDWVSCILRARSFAYFAHDDIKPSFARVWELIRDSPELLKKQ